MNFLLLISNCGYYIQFGAISQYKAKHVYPNYEAVLILASWLVYRCTYGHQNDYTDLIEKTHKVRKSFSISLSKQMLTIIYWIIFDLKIEKMINWNFGAQIGCVKEKIISCSLVLLITSDAFA